MGYWRRQGPASHREKAEFVVCAKKFIEIVCF